MAAEARPHCLLALTHLILLVFLHSTLSAPSTDPDTLVCHMHSNQQVSFRYIFPKGFERRSVKLSVHYKIKDGKVWKLWKEYPPMVTAEIADSIDSPLQPSTLYQLRVTTDPASNISNNECEFCSQTDALDPVYDIYLHSAGPNWFSMTWNTPPRICPRDVNYLISYRISNETRVITYEGHDIMTLNTGQKYLVIRNGLLPSTTYNVSIELSANEFKRTIKSPSTSIIVKTLPKPVPLVLAKPPYVSNATNSTLKLSLNAESMSQYASSATWQFKELGDSVWRFAGKRSPTEDVEISGLNASTMYQVRALLQRDTECEPHESDKVPVVEATTLPVLDPATPQLPPEVTKATNTSLTMVTDLQEGCKKGFIAHWEYKKHNDIWKTAGEEYAFREFTIKGLDPDTDYEVRYKLHWPTSNNYSKFGPEQEAKTCPNSVPRVRYMWPEKRGPHSLTVEWVLDEHCRTQFFMRWKPFNSDDADVEYSQDSYDANKCPYNATFLNCTNMNDCFESVNSYSFTVDENITSGTRYYFEVTAVDWEGRCSESVDLRTASTFEYWRGISVGLWILIVLGIMLLFAAVPICILIKKRVAARLVAGRNVTFSPSCNGSDFNGENRADVDAVIFHEPTTRILDRRSELPDT